jgi:hypothetical protein
VIVETVDGIEVFNDDRVETTAQAERAEANRYPFGSAQKQAALLRMKHAELALRNQPGGFWVAAADPTVVTHAITGQFPLNTVRRVAVLTDGATRLVSMFQLLDWRGVLDVLDEQSRRAGRGTKAATTPRSSTRGSSGRLPAMSGST